MNWRKCLITILLSLSAYAADPSRLPAPQTTPTPPPGGQFPPAGDDTTTSLGTFQIKILDKFVPMISSCPNFNSSTKILSSPTLFDPNTIIGRSDVSLASHDIANTPFELGAVNVGFAGILIDKARLLPPPTYPCFGDTPTTPVSSSIAGQPPDHGPCRSGVGTRKVDTEIRSLRMAGPFTPGSSPAFASQAVVVRAGMHYGEDPPPVGPSPYADIITSPGKVQSRSGPTSDPTQDFPATSFFNVYVKVDIPAGYCGGNPPLTLYNADPLKVVNKMIFNFPPRIVYIHDASSIVPILFLSDGPLWHRGDVLGYFLLAGHGVGFSGAQSDIDAFQSVMNAQTNPACPF